MSRDLCLLWVSVIRYQSRSQSTFSMSGSPQIACAVKLFITFSPRNDKNVADSSFKCTCLKNKFLYFDKKNHLSYSDGPNSKYVNSGSIRSARPSYQLNRPTYLLCCHSVLISFDDTPDNKIYGANVGPTWGHQDPCGPMLATRILLPGTLPLTSTSTSQW